MADETFDADFEAAWQDIEPKLDDDGKGFIINFNLAHNTGQFQIGGGFYARYSEEGMPPLSIDRLRDLLVTAVMTFGHEIFPEEVPDFLADTDAMLDSADSNQ